MFFRHANNTSVPGTTRPADTARLLGPALSGWVAGTAAHLQLVDLPPAGLCLAMMAGAGLAGLAVMPLARRRSGSPWSAWLAWAVVALAAGCLAFSVCGLRAAHFAGSALPPSLEGRDLRVTGTITAMPQRHDDGTRFRLHVAQALLDGQPVRLPPRIDLGWYAGDGNASEVPDLQAGDLWALSVRLKAPHGSSNPAGFDYELWLWEQGVQATGYVRPGAGAPPLLLARGWRHPVERARQAVRDAVFARVADRSAAGVVAALVTGDQNAIERADWDVFRATGVAHLMSISGLHITLFAWLAAAVLNTLWRRSARLCLWYPAPFAALLAGVALAAAYAVFSGWGVPSQRTVWMLAVVAALRLAARRWPWTLVWLLACAVVVTLDPWALLQAGFWLSFVAVGVLFASDAGRAQRDTEAAADPLDPLEPLPAPQPPARWYQRGLASLRRMLGEQLVVTLALAPLTLLLFQQVSLVGLLANLVAIPWVTLVVTPLAMLGILWEPLWQASAAAVQALGWLLSGMAALPAATVSLAAPPVWAGVAGVLGGVVLVLRLPLSLRALGLPLLLPALLWQVPRPAAGEFDLRAADIGQGNAVLVRTARHSLLYDTGPRFSRDADAGQRVLVPLLRAFGERLDTVVVSHRDLDHSGGAQAVLAMQPQAKLLSSIEPAHELQAVRRATRCEAGQRWTWDGVVFEVLHPLADDYARAARPNALSCVLRVTSAAEKGAVSLLLAGDIEQPQEAALLARAATSATSATSALPAAVLLVPHHGSKTSSSGPFLDAVAPRIALVQAGYRNRFGHPAPAVLERYAQRGVRVEGNVFCGAAFWSSAAPDDVLCQRDVARRYWHHRPP